MKRKHNAKCHIDHRLSIGSLCFLSLLNANKLSAQVDSPTVSGDREYAQLGVEVTDSPGTGVLINDVAIGSPAEHSDIRPGDYLLSVNGKPIDAPNDLAAAVRLQKPGSVLTLGLWRNGEESQVNVVVVDMADEAKRTNRAWLGVMLEADGHDGARIARVIPESPAAKAGLRSGDVITAINELPIRSAKELVDAIERFHANETVTLMLHGDPQVKSDVELGSIKAAPPIFSFRLPVPNVESPIVVPDFPSEPWHEELLDLRRQLGEIRKQLRSMIRNRKDGHSDSNDNSPAIENEQSESSSSENGSLRFLAQPEYQNSDYRQGPVRQQYQHSYRYYPPAYNGFQYRDRSQFQYRQGAGPQIPYSRFYHGYPYRLYYGPYYRPGLQVYIGPYGFQYYYR